MGINSKYFNLQRRHLSLSLPPSPPPTFALPPSSLPLPFPHSFFPLPPSSPAPPSSHFCFVFIVLLAVQQFRESSSCHPIPLYLLAWPWSPWVCHTHPCLAPPDQAKPQAQARANARSLQVSRWQRNSCSLVANNLTQKNNIESNYHTVVHVHVPVNMHIYCNTFTVR